MPFHSLTGVPVRVPTRSAFVRASAAPRALSLALLTIGLSGWPAAQTASPTPPLTLEAALRVAQARSQALVAQDAAATSAREMAVAAGQLPDPTLQLAVDNVPANGPKRFSLSDDFMTMRSVGLAQTFTRLDKRRARAARFEREGDAAQAMRAMQLTDLRRSTALAWFDRYYQQQMLELLTRLRDETALQIDAAEATYRGGRGTQADAFMARSAVARIGDRIRAAQARLANAATALTRWVGDAASAPLGKAPLLSRTRLATDAVVHQLDQHPDIALMASKEAVALAEAEVARQDQRADWSVSLMYGQRDSAFSNMLSVGVSVPLLWDQKNRQDRELAAKLAKAEQARAERQEMVREHLAQTQRWLVNWRSNLDRLDDYDATLIPLAAERTRAALAAYRGGNGLLSDVLDARRMEIDTRLERLRIEMETAAVWTELEYLIPEADEAANVAASPHAMLTNTVEKPQ